MTESTSQQKQFRLDGRGVIVTGGGSGIGRAITQKFAASGASLHIVDLDRKVAESAAAEIVAGGAAARAYECDIADQARVRELFQQIFAGERVDILVNSAGIAHIGTIESTSEQDFDRIMRVNVKGFYNTMAACVPHFKNAGGGVILNLASIAATIGIADRFAYSTSKGAVVSMTYSVAKDYLTSKIRCNCISPARVHTPFVDGFLHKNYPGREPEMFAKLSAAQPIGRMCKPEEVASLALFLCSDEASFITGMDYYIDGGAINLRG